MVSHAEQAIEDVVNDCLKSHASNSVNTSADISAHARRDAPGVYLYSHLNTASNEKAQPLSNAPADDAIMLGKIASLGFKIKHGFSYHGVAINLDCDLSAFNAINPCGYAGMQMLRLADFVAMDEQTQDEQTQDEQLAVQAAEQSMQAIANCLSYEQVTQKLIDNIAKRHAGHIQLRALAPK